MIMKFIINLLKKKKSVFIRRHFAVQSINLVRATILYNADEVKSDNDVLYLIMKQIHKNYNITLKPDQIQLLN